MWFKNINLERALTIIEKDVRKENRLLAEMDKKFIQDFSNIINQKIITTIARVTPRQGVGKDALMKQLEEDLQDIVDRYSQIFAWVSSREQQLEEILDEDYYLQKRIQGWDKAGAALKEKSKQKIAEHKLLIELRRYKQVLRDQFAKIKTAIEEIQKQSQGFTLVPKHLKDIQDALLTFQGVELHKRKQFIKVLYDLEQRTREWEKELEKILVEAQREGGKSAAFGIKIEELRLNT